ncbi:MAG: hypothetical protein KKB21_05310 [Nanoarchaeota archaeon]|nr:hypothetical protein [Nanoarchaeota archaeon]MBU4086965.1 hypothetical protein [Nanoarchaeota archaeon]
MKKRGQLTIFIIIAIVVVAVVLIIVFYPRIKMIISPITPSGYVEECITNELEKIIPIVSESGGSLNPQNTIGYDGRQVEYLCYTAEYYKTCVNQQPFLKEHVEEQIASYIRPVAEKCVNDLVSDYEDRGYSVSLKRGNTSVEIVPHSLNVRLNSVITLEKDSTQYFSGFVISRNSEIYDLVMISQSIVNWEARYGDSAPETFMLYYPNLKIEKLKQGDGSKIYIVSERETDESFTFATRSLSWPAGYGADEPFVK